MIETTSRWAHPYPDLDADPDVPRDIKALAESVDGVAMDDQGPLADRPTSSFGSPGQAGRYYYATDTKTLYRDTGTSWVAIRTGEVKITEADIDSGSAGLAKGSFSAYRSGAVNVPFPGNMFVFDAEEWDVSGWYDTTNGRFTPQVAGIYRLTVRIEMLGGAQLIVELRKNGGMFRSLQAESTTSPGGYRPPFSTLAQMNGTTDYVQVYVDRLSGVTGVSTGFGATYFQGELVGRT